MLDDIKKIKLFTRRAMILGGAKFLFFSALGIRFYSLQVSETEKYTTLSYNNTINLSLINPMRGHICDRNHQEIANNIETFNLIINSYDIENIKYTIGQLNNILPIEINFSDIYLKRLIRKSFMRYPLVLATNIKWQTIAKFEFYSHQFPDIAIEHSFKRYYPYDEITSHIVGYTAYPNKEDLKQNGFKRANIPVGKNGIEKVKNLQLIGEPGFIKKEVNALGVSVREIGVTEPKNGQSIDLSIDMRVQKYIAKQLHNKKGSCVVLDVENGHVLGMYSSPTYNPNLFVDGISHEEWQNLVNDKNNPLINKCISTPYPPGSTFKIISSLAMLLSGGNPNRSIVCNGEYEFGDRVFKCWKKNGHGVVNMDKALAQSCNVYFYRMAELAGINNIYNIANILGLNQFTGIELPFENRGLMPNQEWKRKNFGQKWLGGDTVNSAIGQGYVQATPMQLALMIARVATGKVVQPTLLLDNKKKDFLQLNINNQHLDIVRQGLYAVFNKPYGTGYRRRIDIADFKLSGKTGTAQVTSLEAAKENNIKDHGLFVGFAPFHKPKYAIATVVEHSSWGSLQALPISSSVLYYMYINRI